MSAIKAAELWHAGQTTSLYSLLSTGRFHNIEHAEECLDEFQHCMSLIKGFPDAYEQSDEELIQDAMDETEQWIADAEDEVHYG